MPWGTVAAWNGRGARQAGSGWLWMFGVERWSGAQETINKVTHSTAAMYQLMRASTRAFASCHMWHGQALPFVNVTHQMPMLRSPHMPHPNDTATICLCGTQSPRSATSSSAPAAAPSCSTTPPAGAPSRRHTRRQSTPPLRTSRRTRRWGVSLCLLAACSNPVGAHQQYST